MDNQELADLFQAVSAYVNKPESQGAKAAYERAVTPEVMRDVLAVLLAERTPHPSFGAYWKASPLSASLNPRAEVIAWDAWRAGQTSLAVPPAQHVGELPDVDWLSNVIRTADGNHSLGAGALAEKIVDAMRNTALAAPQPAQQGEPVMWSYDISPPAGFIDYVRRNYMGDVHFADPEWHALRLWNAAMKNANPVMVSAEAALRTVRKMIDGSQPKDLPGACMVIDTALRNPSAPHPVSDRGAGLRAAIESALAAPNNHEAERILQAALATQSQAQPGESVDTPEFQRLMFNYGFESRTADAYHTTESVEKMLGAYKALIAHLNGWRDKAVADLRGQLDRLQGTCAEYRSKIAELQVQAAQPVNADTERLNLLLNISGFHFEWISQKCHLLNARGRIAGIGDTERDAIDAAIQASKEGASQ